MLCGETLEHALCLAIELFFHTVSVILFPLHPASLMQNNSQRCKIICGMHPILEAMIDWSIGRCFCRLSCLLYFCSCGCCLTVWLQRLRDSCFWTETQWFWPLDFMTFRKMSPRTYPNYLWQNHWLMSFFLFLNLNIWFNVGAGIQLSSYPLPFRHYKINP